MKKRKNLQAWLTYFEQGARGRVHLGLERVREAAYQLELLPVPYPNVIVGGTNGKGSTSTSIAKILENAGYTVGLYTSPHVFRYHERIAINSQNVSDEQLCEAFACIDDRCSDIFLSYFEVGVLACLWVFKQARLDAAVFEIGLGGRLDAVNIIDPQVSVITTIDFDHMAFLGHSLEAIATEKAGIFRLDVPAIYGDLNPPQAISTIAQSLEAPLFLYQRDFSIQSDQDRLCFKSGTKMIAGLKKFSMHPSNMATALMAIECLNNILPVTDEIKRSTFDHLQVLGRYQRLNRACPWIFDVAHNVQAVSYFMERLSQEKIQGQRKAIFCCMVDKDILGMMQVFLPCFDEVLLVPLAIERAASTTVLKQKCDEAQSRISRSISVKVCASVQAAIDEVDRSNPFDQIAVFGSFYLLEEIFRFFGMDGVAVQYDASATSLILC